MESNRIKENEKIVSLGLDRKAIGSKAEQQPRGKKIMNGSDGVSIVYRTTGKIYFYFVLKIN